MSDFDRVTRIRTPDEAHRALVEACKRGHLRMTVPAQIDDDDMVIGQAIDQWKRDRAHSAALAKALRGLIEEADCVCEEGGSCSRCQARSALASYEAEKGAK